VLKRFSTPRFTIVRPRLAHLPGNEPQQAEEGEQLRQPE